MSSASHDTTGDRGTSAANHGGTPTEGAESPLQQWLSQLALRATPMRIASAISLAALLYALSNSRLHGITFDEPALHYAGDRTLYWLQHFGRPGTLDLLGPDPSDFYSAFERRPAAMDPVHYPVLPGLIGSICNWLLGVKLELINPIDGHHLGLLLLHAFGLLLFCVYSIRLLGRVGGTAASIALALYPCALGHSFNNAKDWPCAMFYGVFMLALGNGVIEARLRDLLSAGLLLGIALACKMNAVFALATSVLWAPIAYLLLYRAKPLPSSVVGGILLIPSLAGAVFIVTWPWLYQGKATDWWMHVHEYVNFMLTFGLGKRPSWTAHAVRCVLFMTPPLLLICAFTYAVIGWRGSRRCQAIWALQMLWFGLPVLRISVPGSNYYDANRHFIEYIPGLCAVAGAGVAWIGKQIHQRLHEGRLGAALAVRALPLMGTGALIGVLLLAWPVAEYRPHETTYFNVFAGGLGGAQREGLFMAQPPVDHLVNGTEGDYWFGSLRVGLQAAHKLVEPGREIGICGTSLWLAQANWPKRVKPRLSANIDQAPVVFASPREFFCGMATIQELEAKRPILKRVERGGGLVYEILGPVDGKVHPVVTAASVYTQPAWYAKRK